MFYVLMFLMFCVLFYSRFWGFVPCWIEGVVLALMFPSALRYVRGSFLMYIYIMVFAPVTILSIYHKCG